MAIIDVYNRARDVTYVYESVSYWDKEKKQPRSRRKLIGKRDPETGEIIPTGKRGRKKKAPDHDESSSAHSDTDYKSLYEQTLSEKNRLESKVLDLQKQIASLSLENEQYKNKLDKIRNIVK